MTLRMPKMVVAIPALIAGVASLPAVALADFNIEAVPTSWRLQEYVSGSIYVWGSNVPNCGNGGLSFTGSATEETKQRFWSTILTAKMSQKIVGIFYDNNNGTCTINSFYLKEE